ncbi:MAG TPA: hypothetical protein VMZ91_03110 [Candidatus Paceibacterota bacterium]|nr:hypothetical protein [Candidatus Paceibacterota bacterium]
MTKIDDITFYCDWCGNKQEHHAGKNNWHGHIVCNKCCRNISQKKKLKL